MNQYISFAFAFLCVGVVVTGGRIKTPRYYWRPYNGTIPSDAITAGYSNEKQVYIGQAHVETTVIPGKIQNGDANVYFEWDEEAWATSSSVKVLCTQKPKAYVWIFTSNAKLFKMDKYQLVIGGYQHGLETYIGRVYVDDETVVGKVICSDSYCYALYGVKGDKQVEYHLYEVLAYIPESNEINAPGNSADIMIVNIRYYSVILVCILFINIDR